MSESTPMIEAVKLSKTYGTFAALRDVSFSVMPGEVVAFLGPNGAGKSTTMKILMGYLSPTSGQAKLAGLSMDTHRIEAAAKVGYLPENGPFYPEMTPRELLQFFAEARAMDKKLTAQRIEEVTETCSLGLILEKPMGKLSKGNRQRVGMAQVLLHDPEILIMDEPTSGLDPNQIQHVREMIKKLGETKTILLSTHILQEVEAMASRVLMINEGKIVFDGIPTDFKKEGAEDWQQAFHNLTGVA